MSTSGVGLWQTLVEDTFAPVPLTGVSVKVSIINLVAEVEVIQSFFNEENKSIEAVYKFYLTEGASMCRFSAEVDGQEIKSVVKEKDDEASNHDEATRRAPSASMMKEQQPDVFTFKVGKVAAKSNVVIRVKYIMELKIEGEEVRFLLPRSVAPSYLPTTNDESATAGFVSKLSPLARLTQKVPYKLEFKAVVSMLAGINSIRSSSHKIWISNGLRKHHLFNNMNCSRMVTLSDEVTFMDQDLLLFVKVENPYEGCLVLEESATGSSALMLSILPKFKHEEERKAELIFVIDRSRTMNEAKIQQAMAALLLFLHSVRADCYVNFVGLCTKSHVFFPSGSQKFDDIILRIVKRYIAVMDSDDVETKVLKQLQAAFELPTVKGYVRQVVVITDGLISDKEDVISLVKQFSASTARVYALGLGRDISRDFVDQMARAGDGTALYASREEEFEEKVTQLLRDTTDALLPSWSNLELKWESFSKEDMTVSSLLPIPLLRQAPATGTIPSVFSGQPLIVYALLSEGMPIPQKATLTMNTPEKTALSIKFLVKPMRSDGDLIHRMAAKKLIQGLQHRSDPIAKEETIKLALTFGLSSSLTTFVAVDPMNPDMSPEGSLMIVTSKGVPVQLPHDTAAAVETLIHIFVVFIRKLPVGKMMRLSVRRFDTIAAVKLVIQKIEGIPTARQHLTYRGHHLVDTCSLATFNIGEKDVIFLEDTRLPQYGQAVPAFESVLDNADNFKNLEYRCDLCDTVFTEKRSLVRHEKNQHTKLEEHLASDKIVMQLIDLQHSNGSFKLNDDFCKILDSSLDDITEAGRKAKCPDELWPTLIAVSYLTLGLPKFRDSWALVVEKANQWLSTHKFEKRMIQKAAKFINAKLKF